MAVVDESFERIFDEGNPETNPRIVSNGITYTAHPYLNFTEEPGSSRSVDAAT